LISRIIHFALHQRALVLVAALALLAWGAYSFTQLPIEAYPDVMNTQVQVITQWPGHAAEEVEKLITVPLETELNSVPRVSSLRSRSLFGLSVVYLTFDDGVDDYFAREQVNELVGQVTLPNGVQPSMSPLSSATGEIFRYTVTGAPLTDLKTLEDWTLEREFKSIPGVADVSSFGGTIKQYQIQVDPAKLKAYDVTLKNVTDAITAANANAGGNFVERGSEEYVVRGIGLLRDERDIGDVVITAHAGTPVRVRDIANVRVGYQTRLGKVGWRPGSGGPETDVDDAVEGTILLRRGENPDPVLQAIHKKIAELNAGRLPAGVKIIPFIDRTDLVHTTSHTVEHNLLEGMALVVAVLLLFLGNVRAAVIVSLTIPFGLLFAFSCMNLIHVPANLISLGAIDFGVIVNGSVIMVENLYRRLAERKPDQSVMACILAASKEVETEIFFTTLIIIIAYLPLFTMQSVEKKMFTPMAYTISLALVGSLLMALLVAPVLCYLLLRRGLKQASATGPMERLKRGYRNVLAWTISNPLPALVAACGLFAVSILVLPQLGTEFLPHLDEGNLWIRATLPNTISYTEASRIVPKVRAIMAKYQPVRLVVSQSGRPDDGTDATGFYNAEFLVDLKPYDQWRGFRNKDELISKMSAELNEIPGVSFNFSQNIEDNVEEAVTGVKGELAVKLFGEDLNVLEKKAAEIQDVMSKIRGVVDLSTFTETGEPQIEVRADRDRIARYGLNVQDVDDAVETAIGGKAITQLLDGEKKFDVVVRLQPESRRDVDEIRNISLSTPDDQRIPLAQVADVRLVRGASFVYREGNRRFIAIKFGIRGRDIGGAVAEAQARVRQAVSLPGGYYTVWGGEFESLQRAQARLMLILPITLLLIFFVLFLLFNTVSRSVIVMLNVPLALIGGIFALYLAHFHLSVSAAVGFIALFGVAVQNGVILVSYCDHLIAGGESVLNAALDGAATRLRPVLMTAILAGIGLVPAAVSKGIGSDTQKPLAIVIIGGLISATILTLFVLPILYYYVANWLPNRTGQLASVEHAPNGASFSSNSDETAGPGSLTPQDGR
jgi:cobalt-zinc-cadmium resistance protein CzcA